jgi:ABC-type uncharacterized transport system involved in gliding motility auxiliary subunit
MMYLQQGMQPPEPQEQFSRIAELMNQGHYEAVPVEITEASPIPDDVDLLIVLANSQLNERQVYEINRALRGGLPVVMAVQAHEYGYSPGQNGGWSVGGQAVDTGLEGMLTDFGLALSEDHFMDASMEVIELPREVNFGGLRMQTREPVKLPVQIRVTESQMYQDSPLVNRISSLFYLWGTPIQVDKDRLSTHGLQVTNLIESSPDSWSEPWSEGLISGSVFNRSGKEMLGPQTLAVLATGIFPDTFDGRQVPDWPATEAPPEQDAATPPAGPEAPAPIEPQPASLLLVGSAKMFDDNIIAAPQNALLMLNAVDYLAGSRDLLTIRSKALTNRVIKPVGDRQKMLWKIFVVLVVPVLFAVYGFMRAGMRRKEATRYREGLRQRPGHFAS